MDEREYRRGRKDGASGGFRGPSGSDARERVAALLDGQSATFGDVVSAVTYLKRPADAERLREKFQEAGYEGFPNVLVEAPICRPELLCETEALAVLPKTGTNASGHS